MIWLYWLVDLVFLALVMKFVIDILLVLWGSVFYGVPYVPTKMGLVKEMVKRVGLKKGMRVVELGSGDGRVSILFAREYEVEVLGVEKMRWLLWMSKLRALFTRKKGKVSFERRDLFQMDLGSYDLVYMYLLPRMIERLRPKLEKQLKKGSLVVSFDYPFTSNKFSLKEEVGEKQKIWIYKLVA